MGQMTLAQARELCTQAEMELFVSNRGTPLAKQSPAELQSSRLRARQLRDKWRDLSTKQRRSLQSAKGTRDVEKSQRSALKAQLFQETLDRIQARLDELPRDQVATAKPAAKTTKQQRTVEHRAGRAAIRKQLQEVQEEKIVLARTLPAATSAQESAAPAVPEPVAVTAPPQPKSKTPRKAQKPPQKPTLDRVQQVNSRAAAKLQRKQVSGKTTRMQGHVSARGKRSQAARDKK